MSVDFVPKGFKEEVKDLEEDLREKASGYSDKISTYFKGKISKAAEEMQKDANHPVHGFRSGKPGL